MVKSISQYLGVLHLPNLDHMYILTWSNDVTWCPWPTFHTSVTTTQNGSSPFDDSHNNNVYFNTLSDGHKFSLLSCFWVTLWIWHCQPTDGVIFSKPGHMSGELILCHRPSVSTWCVNKNFNLGHNFITRRDKAFILHMCVACVKTFHMVP